MTVQQAISAFSFAFVLCMKTHFESEGQESECYGKRATKLAETRCFSNVSSNNISFSDASDY